MTVTLLLLWLARDASRLRESTVTACHDRERVHHLLLVWLTPTLTLTLTLTLSLTQDLTLILILTRILTLTLTLTLTPALTLTPP